MNNINKTRIQNKNVSGAQSTESFSTPSRQAAKNIKLPNAEMIPAASMLMHAVVIKIKYINPFQNNVEFENLPINPVNVFFITTGMSLIVEFQIFFILIILFVNFPFTQFIIIIKILIG